MGQSLSLQPFLPPDARTLGPHSPLPCRPQAFTSPRPLLSVRAHVPGPSVPQEVTQGLGVSLGRVSLELAPRVTPGARRGTGGSGEPLLLGGPSGQAPPPPRPSVPGCWLRCRRLPVWAHWALPPGPAVRLGPQRLPLVPGAAQEVGGEGRRHGSRRGLGSGPCVGSARA